MTALSRADPGRPNGLGDGKPLASLPEGPGGVLGCPVRALGQQVTGTATRLSKISEVSHGRPELGRNGHPDGRPGRGRPRDRGGRVGGACKAAVKFIMPAVGCPVPFWRWASGAVKLGNRPRLHSHDTGWSPSTVRDCPINGILRESIDNRHKAPST
jgi:hypothetical protein